LIGNTGSQRQPIRRCGDGACKHLATEHLGFYNDVTFLRCQDCHDVLVRQGALCWAIPKPRDPGRDSAFTDLRALRFSEQYRENALLADGTEVALRLIRPSDSGLLISGFERLSSESRYRRFFGYKKALSSAELEYFTHCDGINHFAIGAVANGPNGEEQGVGIARFVRLAIDATVADAAVTVIDIVQNKGLGRLLVDRLFAAAAERGIGQLRFSVLASNQPMLAILRKLKTSGAPGLESSLGRGVLQFSVPVRSQAGAASAV
jgi:GNAT superfamily N-acetyltransferase